MFRDLMRVVNIGRQCMRNGSWTTDYYHMQNSINRYNEEASEGYVFKLGLDIDSIEFRGQVSMVSYVNG